MTKQSSKHTPGPFLSDGRGGSGVYRGKGPGLIYVGNLSRLRGEAERAELIDLLNKGTHFDGILAALKAVDKELNTHDLVLTAIELPIAVATEMLAALKAVDKELNTHDLVLTAIAKAEGS